MSHNTASLVPWVASFTDSFSAAGAATFTLTGFGLSLSTDVDLSTLGVETGRAYTATDANGNGNLVISLTVATLPDPVATVQVKVSTGGVKAQQSPLSVQHGQFDPLSISGATLWLDGADESTFTKSANKISEWRDKSGNNHDFEQLTGNRQPTYIPNTVGGGSGAFSSKGGAVSISGLAGLGNETYLSSGSFAAGNASHHCTMFIVVSKRANGGGSGYGEYIFRGSSLWDVPLILRYNDGSSWVNNRFASAFPGGRLNGTSTVTNGSRHLATITHKGAGANETLRIDGVEEASGEMSTTSIGVSNVYQVGAHTLIAEAEIAEVLFYDSILSDTDRDAVESYLTGKWGV